jgi:hypothetical protein
MNHNLHLCVPVAVITATALGAFFLSKPHSMNAAAVRPSATPSPNCLNDPVCPDWVMRYDGSGGYDRGVGVVTSPDGSRVYVTGISTNSAGNLDFATIAYDAHTAQQLWVTRYNGPAGGNDQPYYFGTGKQIAISRDGSTLFVIGLSARTDGFNDYVTIAYRTIDGAQLWASRYSTTRDSIGSALALSSDGSRVYVTGYSSVAVASGTENYDFATIAYDTATGNQLWVARYDGPASFWDIPYSIGAGNVRQSDGSRREQVFVTGRSNGASSANTDADFATVAYDGLSGTQLWVARYNGPANDRDLAYDLRISPDGSFVFITGESAGSGTLADYATICYDALTGAQRWIARYDHGDIDVPLGLAISPTGDRVAVTGFSADPPIGIPLRDAATIVYDAVTGAQLWASRHTEADGAAASHVAFSLDGRRLYVSGLENGNVVAISNGGVGLQGGHSPALTLAYDASNGTELWATHYLGSAGDEGNFDLTISHDDAHVFVTGGGSSSAADIVTLSYPTGAPTPPPVQLNAVASRKVHGDAGTFNVDLPLGGNPGIECRSGGPNGEHTMIFTFANSLTSVATASITSGTGSVTRGNIDSNDGHNYIVNLSSVTNSQVITVNLANVYDSAGNGSSSVSASMGVLLGDVNANGVVSNTDVSLVKAQVAAAVGSTNFREDVNANGVISNTDVSLTKAQVGSQLP